MNENKIIEKLKETLKEALMSDELEDVLFYLDEYEKYKKAYEYLLTFWDSLSKEQQEKANKELNKIFGKEHKEYLKE